MSDSSSKQLVVLKEPESVDGKPVRQKPKKVALEEDDFTEVNHQLLNLILNQVINYNYIYYI